MMTKRTLILAVLLVSLLAPAAVAAGPSTEAATLSIQQPHYISSDVQTTTANGTTVYEVSGSRIEIAPENFNADDVTDYGISTPSDGAMLSYDREFGEFIFTAEKTGTYTVYWSVEESVAVTNETTNETTVEQRSQRYEAKIRVTGQTDMVHKPAGWDDDLQEKASKWEAFNATVAELRGDSLFVKLGLQEEQSTQEIIQKMVNAFLTLHSPLKMLTGDFTTIAFLVGTSLGGWLFIALILGPLLIALAYAYRKLNRHESIEAQEGELSQRVANLDLKEAKSKLAFWTFNDVTDDDHMAESMRDEGRNPLQALSNRESKLSGQHVFHAFLQAMAQCGYVAKVERRVEPDGGDDDGGRVVEAEVVHQDEVADDADTVSLEVDRPDAPLLDAIDPEQNEIYEFDLLNADFDRSEVNATPIDAYDLDDLIETTELDLRRFGSVETAARYQVEYLYDVCQHPITNDRGSVDSFRYWLEQNLDTANILNDRFPIPMEYRARLWEAAIDQYDGAAKAEETLRDVREGADA